MKRRQNPPEGRSEGVGHTGGAKEVESRGSKRYTKVVSISRQKLQNATSREVACNTANYLLASGTVLAKTLKSTHTQIGAYPFAKTRRSRKCLHGMSVVPIGHMPNGVTARGRS